MENVIEFRITPNDNNDDNGNNKKCGKFETV